MTKMLSNKRAVFLFLLPALILFVGILIAPIIMSLYYSLYNWDGFGEMEFLGIKNYIELFTSGDVGFMRAVGNALLLAVISVCIQLPLALWFALKLGSGIKGERAFLSIYFMPVLISTVVIGQLWLKIYHPSYGLLTKLFEFLKIDILPRAGLLGDKKTILLACFIPMVWQYVGYHMLLMYAGVKSVPRDLREAAMLDGATDGQIDRMIVIPYIKQILKVSVIFSVTGSLKSFDMIYVLMGSAHNHPAEVPSTRMIAMLFERNRYGMGSAIAVILILLCFAFALLIGFFFKEEED